MTANGQSDLLADLQVDLHRVPEAAPRLPALELRLTPLHWRAPSLVRRSGGWALDGGPVHLALVLHA